MIEGLYFRFYKITHSEKISLVLAYLSRFAFFLIFLLKRLTLIKEKVIISKEEALGLLQKSNPDPGIKPDYSLAQKDEKCCLSIIVPVYNHIDVIERCIDSLLEQITCFSYEIILVDDGSTDGAQLCIEKYNVYDKVHIIHQSNMGIASARNTGLCYAHGMYFMFVDCDDYVHNDLVEVLMKTAIQEKADIVMCAHALVKAKNGHVYSRLPNIYPQYNLNGFKNNDDIMNYAGLPWGKVFSRELLENVRFFPGYWYEDTIVQFLLFTRCSKFVYVPEVKYEYQWNEENFSHVQGAKSNNKAIDRYWLLIAIIKRYFELGCNADAMFYTLLLKHVSTYYYPSISGLSEDIIQAMFIAGRELLLQYMPSQKVKLPYMLRLTEKSMLRNDIALWKLCSLNQ